MWIWLFPKIGGKPPKWMVKIMETPIKMDDLGVPDFWKHPFLKNFQSLPCQKFGNGNFKRILESCESRFLVQLSCMSETHQFIRHTALEKWHLSTAKPPCTKKNGWGSKRTWSCCSPRGVRNLVTSLPKALITKKQVPEMWPRILGDTKNAGKPTS